MQPSCEDLRPRLELEAGSPPPWSGGVEEHVAGCAECAARAERLRAQAAALGGLERLEAPPGLADRVSFAFEPLARGVRAGSHLARLRRLSAPGELDGWVVAALQAGSRQERAVRGLDSLSPLSAPPILGPLVRDLALASGPEEGSRPAPEALEERVADDLICLPRAQVRRAASRLGRRAGLGSGVPRRSDRGAPRTRGLKLLLGLSATLAVLLLAYSRAPSVDPESAARERIATPLAQPAGPEQSLPGLAAGLADGLTGGLWSLERALISETGSAQARQALEPVPPRPGPRPSGPLSLRSSGSSRAPLATQVPAPSAPAGRDRAASGSFLGRLSTSANSHSFRGVRVVELHLEPGGVPSLAYREEVLADAEGRFAVEPLEVLVHAGRQLASEEFLVLQKAREGFVFRHRDFRVREPALFLDRYQMIEIDADAIVAGRPSSEFEVSRIQGAERTYRVWFDQATGLVLAYEEYLPGGSLSARVEYQTFELDPDLDGVPLSGGPTIFDPIDLNDPDQHPFPLNAPVAVPPGFVLTELAAASDPTDGSDWVRFTYGDGLEQVFLLLGPPARRPASGGSGLPQTHPGPVPLAGSRLWHYTVGAWSVVQGEIGGRQVAALGKVDWTELDLLVQSAIEAP